MKPVPTGTKQSKPTPRHLSVKSIPIAPLVIGGGVDWSVRQVETDVIAAEADSWATVEVNLDGDTHITFGEPNTRMELTFALPATKLLLSYLAEAGEYLPPDSGGDSTPLSDGG